MNSCRKKYLGLSIITWFGFLLSLPLLGIDDYYRFTESSIPGSTVFETSRKLCIFSFRSPKEDKNLNYLSTGIPSVLFGELQKIEIIYEPSVLPLQRTYTMGKPGSPSSAKENENISNKIYNDELLKKIYQGEVKLLPIKDPRYITLEVSLDEKTKPTTVEDIKPIARDTKCSYILTGEFKKESEDILSIQVELYSRVDGTHKTYTHKSSIKRAFQEMMPLSVSIRGFFQEKMNATIQIETPDPNAFVYLDGIFIGKTPLPKTSIHSGSHELIVFQEGKELHKETITVLENSHFQRTIKLKNNEKSAKITVHSEPSGAEVFLGSKFIGTTPLEGVTVPAGSNRLRVSLDGHVDLFKSVDLAKNTEQTHKVVLRLGDSEIYYKNKQFLFLDYTYKDFSFYSLYTALLFYGSHVYWNLEANKIRDGLRPQITITNFSAFQALNSNDPSMALAVFAYESQKISANERLYDRYKLYGGTLGIRTRNESFQMGYSLGGILVSLAASLGFYYLSFDAESIDIGYRPVLSPNPLMTTRRLGECKNNECFGYIPTTSNPWMDGNTPFLGWEAVVGYRKRF